MKNQKRKISTLILFMLTIIAFGQYNNYDRGFQNGYKEGYCYNDYGCISPIPPITPIPLVGEQGDDFQDGYNRGFKRGLEDKQIKKNTDNYNNQGNNSYRQQDNSTKQPYVSSYVSPNYNVLLNLLEARKAQYEQNEQIKKEKAISFMNQVKSYYNSLNSYPEKINDGWHKVISLNNYDFCEERKVYVENNKVTKYVIDNWMSKSISYPPVINKAKTMVQLVEDDGTNGDMVELYFLEDINNPNAYTEPPIGSGKISFYTNIKNSGNMELYFDGEYAGKFTSYFSDGRPNCGQQGTITITYKPGTYSYKAISEGGWGTKTWEGTVTITSGGCNLQGLVK